MINGQAGLIGIALAHGLALAVVRISRVRRISEGHFNLAVTTGFLVTGSMLVGEWGAILDPRSSGPLSQWSCCWLSSLERKKLTWVAKP